MSLSGNRRASGRPAGGRRTRPRVQTKSTGARGPNAMRKRAGRDQSTSASAIACVEESRVWARLNKQNNAADARARAYTHTRARAHIYASDNIIVTLFELSSSLHKYWRRVRTPVPVFFKRFYFKNRFLWTRTPPSLFSCGVDDVAGTSRELLRRSPRYRWYTILYLDIIFPCVYTQSLNNLMIIDNAQHCVYTVRGVALETR